MEGWIDERMVQRMNERIDGRIVIKMVMGIVGDSQMNLINVMSLCYLVGRVSLCLQGVGPAPCRPEPTLEGVCGHQRLEGSLQLQPKMFPPEGCEFITKSSVNE